MARGQTLFQDTKQWRGLPALPARRRFLAELALRGVTRSELITEELSGVECVDDELELLRQDLLGALLRYHRQASHLDRPRERMAACLKVLYSPLLQNDGPEPVETPVPSDSLGDHSDTVN